MNYQQCLDYLYARLPMFQRIGPAAYKANLDNTHALAAHLQHPENQFKSIHIAGTNGKGSVAHLLASVFQEAGYKTGLCTSPHLKDFRERIRINGEKIPEAYVADFVSTHQPFFDQLNPSFFEVTIALAFAHFATEKVDMAIVETGLGGRLDSTNIITPQLSVITNIGLDHTNLLGNTLEAIAREKAGIIKPGIPVVIGRSQKETRPVFLEKANQSPVMFAEETCEIQNPENIYKNQELLLKAQIRESQKITHIECPLTGTYQYENLCTVYTAVKQINQDGNFSIPEQAMRAGIRNVVKNTEMAGRWQVLQQNPPVICDTGHNADGIKVVTHNIGKIPHRHLHFVLGMTNDKDVEDILGLLPQQNTSYYYCRPDVPRGLSEDILYEKATRMGFRGEKYASVRTALQKALSNAQNNDLVFVGGSTFVVAEVV